MSILLIDDDGNVLEIIKEYIENAGDYSVTAVANTAIALDLIQARDYSIIISDINMPGINGIEFIKLIRMHCPAAGIIMISGQAQNEHVNRIKALGAAAFYTKPLRFDRLMEHIEELSADFAGK